MKTLSSAFRVTASGDQNQPLELYTLYLDDITVRMVNYDKNINYYDIDGDTLQTYYAIPVHREGYERTTENPINSIRLNVANVDKAMSSYLASHEFRGRRIIIRKTFANQLTSSGDMAIIFDGVMDSPAASEQTVQINAMDRIGSLKREAPKRWYQLLCNNKFFDEQCAFGRTSGDMYQTVNGTCFSGCSKTQIHSLDLTQVDDYWLDGEIRMTSGQNGMKRRKIVASNQANNTANLDISLEYTSASGDTFAISRGCDKTWYRCSGDFQNDANIAAYPTIPEQIG